MELIFTSNTFLTFCFLFLLIKILKKSKTLEAVVMSFFLTIIFTLIENIHGFFPIGILLPIAFVFFEFTTCFMGYRKPSSYRTYTVYMSSILIFVWFLSLLKN